LKTRTSPVTAACVSLPPATAAAGEVLAAAGAGIITCKTKFQEMKHIIII